MEAIRKYNSITFRSFAAAFCLGNLLVFFLSDVYSNLWLYIAQLLLSGLLSWIVAYQYFRNWPGICLSVSMPHLLFVLVFSTPIDKSANIYYFLVCNAVAISCHILLNRYTADIRQLPKEGQIAFCRTILRMEMENLGLTRPISLYIEACEPNISGYTPFTWDCIYLNKSLWAEGPDVKELIDIIAHEAFHIFQEDLVLYEQYRKDMSSAEKRRIEQYRHEMRHYKSSSTDPKAYKKQHLEIDASAYAKERWNTFYKAHWRSILKSCQANLTSANND